MQQVDIAIVGGGMAGTTLALALAQQEFSPAGEAPRRWRVALIEARPVSDTDHPGFDSRAIALAHGSVQHYQQLGLWPLLAGGAAAIDRIHVSDRGHWGQVRMSAAEQGVDALGQVVELERVGPVLHRALADTEVQLYCPDQLASMSQHRDYCELSLTSGQTLKAGLVVAADGGTSRVRQHLNLPLQRSDYEQVAVIANVRMANVGSTAFERFTDEGPLALLPMSDGRYSLVWVRSQPQAERILQLSDAAFAAELQRAFGFRLGAVEQVGKRASYPLALQRVSKPVHHRVVLIGNAAQTLHPIAGQGFNLGLRDVMTLSQRLQLSLQQQADPGAFSVLDDYWCARQADVERTVSLTNGLVKLFSNNNPVLQVGRNLGLMAMDWMPTLAQGLVSQTMGQGSSVRKAQW
ncbi:2-octaprenyl-6-methoxyphenyl hydroxylase [Ferrimonas sp. SCSIO 43195]|uniref:2-octaprenyl-6-methoxyphenyl hydroxylase n=1 Tax=Ferrimonas sp. SCSIO 43195 TaxID=2822844 RepID=UPI00207571B6|nr:2-octaprenyl-6-methoxyphenyl hydroxylase [Ferrimonas sp. SCSIO 43195]USD38107.1 2-octaprenyl-6-methoxyphenyl hydroxylase [Ferrimonas sp. SCSIO 43195]